MEVATATVKRFLLQNLLQCQAMLPSHNSQHGVTFEPSNRRRVDFWTGNRLSKCRVARHSSSAAAGQLGSSGRAGKQTAARKCQSASQPTSSVKRQLAMGRCLWRDRPALEEGLGRRVLHACGRPPLAGLSGRSAGGGRGIGRRDLTIEAPQRANPQAQWPCPTDGCRRVPPRGLARGWGS